MRILIITYHLYDATAQAHCSRKLVNALLDEGAEITCITSGGEDIFNPEQLMAQKLKCQHEFIPVARDWTKTPFGKKHIIAKIMTRVRLFLLGIFGLSLLDRTWATQACKRITSSYDSENFDIVLSILNPPQSHLCALCLKGKWAKPWVAFFSDPWPGFTYPGGYQFGLTKKVEKKQGVLMEKFVDTCDLILSPSERMSKYVDQFYPGFLAKSLLFPHLICLRESSRNSLLQKESLRIVHSGALHPQRGGKHILQALNLLFEKHPACRKFICVEFLGQESDLEFRKAIEKSDLSKNVSYLGYKPYEDTLQYIAQSDVLLLAEAKLDEGIFFPSKLADYLGVKRPILAISPEPGLARDYLGEKGFLAHPGNAQSIADAFSEVFFAWNENRLDDYIVSPSSLIHSTPSHVARRSLQHFNDLLKKGE